uniref:Uncharacterized protein n=1 Tax=Anguilla anguilla TaxID=7936 RepID=A0A0E9SGJ2_ANGAN
MDKNLTTLSPRSERMNSCLVY